MMKLPVRAPPAYVPFSPANTHSALAIRPTRTPRKDRNSNAVDISSGMVENRTRTHACDQCGDDASGRLCCAGR